MTKDLLELPDGGLSPGTCLKPYDALGGRCCCSCRHLAEDRHHPTTSNVSISEQRGWVCLAPEFYAGTGHRRIVFSGWSEHGGCEMHDDLPHGPRRTP